MIRNRCILTRELAERRSFAILIRDDEFAINYDTQCIMIRNRCILTRELAGRRSFVILIRDDEL